MSGVREASAGEEVLAVFSRGGGFRNLYKYALTSSLLLSR